MGSFTSPRHQHGQGTDGTDPATGVRLTGNAATHLRAPRTPQSHDAARPRRPGHHRHGHHAPGDPPVRSRDRPARHRRDHHPRRSPPARLHRRPRARCTRHHERGPRPRPHRGALLPRAAQSPRPAASALPGRGLHGPRTLDRGPPHHPSGQKEGRPTSRTASCCATGTTKEPTTPATAPNGCPMATSDTTGAGENPGCDTASRAAAPSQSKRPRKHRRWRRHPRLPRRRERPRGHRDPRVHASSMGTSFDGVGSCPDCPTGVAHLSSIAESSAPNTHRRTTGGTGSVNTTARHRTSSPTPS